jgi:hypothetical protein
VANSPAPLAEVLARAGAGLAGPLEERLPELVLSGLAAPQFRLPGAEGLVLDRLRTTLAGMGRKAHAEAEALVKEAAATHAQLLPVRDALARGSFWGWGKKDRLAADFLQRLRCYGTHLYQAMIRQAQGVLYAQLHDAFHKYPRRVDCCRGRIAQFLEGFQDSAGASAQVDLGLGQYLLPAGCRTLPEAVEQILSCLTAEEQHEINRRVEGVIGRALEAQIHVCTAPAEFFRDLEEHVLNEVTAFAESPLGRAHAAELYLAQRGEDNRAVDELAGAFDEAAPDLAGPHPADDELSFLAVPAGVEGEHFRRLVQQALPEQTFIPVASTDDIVFHREVLGVSLAALPQRGHAAAAVYRQLLTGDVLTPHSRIDITDWRSK